LLVDKIYGVSQDMDPEVEAIMARLIRIYDDNKADADALSTDCYIANLAAEARNKFHLQQFVESDRLVVRDFISREMKERGMRATHIAKWLDVATVLAFFPTRGELLSRHLLSTSIGQDRMEKTTTPIVEEVSRPRTVVEALFGTRLVNNRPASN
jgi:hypothetical protein